MSSQNKMDKNSVVNHFILKLRLQKFENDQEKAEQTLKTLEHLISQKDINSARQMVDSLLLVASLLQSQMPFETTPYNMVQRVIKIVKDECMQLKKCDKSSSSQSLSESINEDMNLYSEVDHLQLQANIVLLLSEQKVELEQCQEFIASQGESKIHSDEIVLTCGFCPSVLAFLLSAATKRRFHIIVVEGAPKYGGHKMAKLTSEAGVQTMLVRDAAIFPMMSRVNKVIIGANTVFANGGMDTFVGAASLACAAKYYSVPLYVCAPTYKFSKATSFESLATEFDSLKAASGGRSLGEVMDGVNAAVAKSDYVPPEHVASFVTNNRGIAPSYVYRQVRELYESAEDVI